MGNLVLSRHRGESIIIHGIVKVTIVSIRGEKVRVSVQAPDEVTVNREEVELAIQREKQAQVATG